MEAKIPFPTQPILKQALPLVFAGAKGSSPRSLTDAQCCPGPARVDHWVTHDIKMGRRLVHSVLDLAGMHRSPAGTRFSG